MINKLANNQRGMSLIQVTVAMGLVGVLAMIVMELQKQTLDVNVNVKNDMELADLGRRVSSILAKKESCEVNFKDNPLNQEYSVFKSKIGSSERVIFRVGQKLNNTLTITGIKTKENPDTAGEMDLVFTLEKAKRPNQDGMSIIRDFAINVFTDASGVITSCYSDYSNMVETAVRLACEDSPGLIYDEETMKCRAIKQVQSINCGEGQALTSLVFDESTFQYTPTCSDISIDIGDFIDSSEVFIDGKTCRLVGNGSGQVKLSCDSPACVPVNSCTELISRTCSNQSAGTDSCGNSCGMGEKNLQAGCPLPSSLCVGQIGYLSECNVPCLGTMTCLSN